MWQQSIRVIACLGLIASCDGAEEPGTDVALHAHGPPVMSTRPAWSVSGPTDTPGTCFGAAATVEDLDGDGHRDLAVVELGCFYDLFAPGRIAIYRGVGTAFSTTPVWTTLDWQRPLTFAFSATLATGDVDGDGRPDLLVGDSNGALVYAHITSVAAPLGAPTYRVITTTGRFGRATLADVDGDHRAEVVSLRSGTATVWRASGASLVAARAFTGVATFVAPGDADGDGRNDLVVVSAAGASSLYRGCAPAASGCEGGLRATPAWTFDRAVVAMVPDLDGDGRQEAFVEDPGRSPGWSWLHLSDAVTGLEPDAAWSSLGDPTYPVFGGSVVVPGDLDGDHRTTDILVAAAGRAYAFFPRGAHHLDRMEPGFAWPRHDRVQDQILAGEPQFGDSATVLARAGDLDHDGYADLVVAVGSVQLDQKPGAVYLFRGGEVVDDDHGHGELDPPYLPGEHVCNLDSGGLPDLTVDAAVLARSMYVDRLDFAADSCELAEACVGGAGERKLLRFTTSIVNLGTGPLIIPGPDTDPDLYHFDECHQHYHLDDFARYELVDASGSTVAVGRKQGFFMIDSQPYCSDGESSTDYFPDQGVSAGWADVYVASIPCQWLDVTGVPDGRYTLKVTADSQHLVEQDDVLSDTASVRLRLQGDRVRVLP